MNKKDLTPQKKLLSELENGEKAIIVKIKGRGAFRKRIMEMGFIKGKEVAVIKNAPLRDPIEYKIMDYNISLRRKEAQLIEVLTHTKPDKNQHSFSVNQPDDNFKTRVTLNSKEINIALIGNPNCGKTTLFNVLCGSKEKVGNYSGVTVDAKEAKIQYEGYTFNIVDLPGTYSLTAYTSEEIFVRDHIINQAPDIVINVLDAANLERNMYLTTQLIDMDIRVIAALNMFDELEKKGDKLNYETLGKMIGIPFVPTVASKGIGLQDLLQKTIDVFEEENETSRHIHINYGHDIEKSINKIQNKIRQNDCTHLLSLISSRFCAIKLLEKDKEVENMIFENLENNLDVLLIARQEIDHLEDHLKEDSEALITDAKYGFISGALKENFEVRTKIKRTLSEKIDSIITHPFLGFPIFLGFMWLTFQLTFSLGQYPMDVIDAFVNGIGNFLSKNMVDGILKSLIIDGALSGVGGVIIFLPNILILFFMISFMEDTGYMARASFIMDKLMHKLGLHGKSFIPLIMGFGCNVPAIMATRTLESRNDRLLTMMIIPFMSCSARLPVYVLFLSAFFPANAGSMLFFLYLFGILFGVISALIMKKAFFNTYEIPFVMELPPYRIPHIKTSLSHMWEKGVEYLKKIAGVVLIASVLIWGLGQLPLNKKLSENFDKKITTIESNYKAKAKKNPLEKKLLLTEMKSQTKEIENARDLELLEKSYIGKIGKFMEPLFAPLGFDWRMSVSIITGLAAKEIVVSTIGVLYQAGPGHNEESKTLITKLKTSGNKSSGGFTPLKALAFMIFVLLYFPCIATIATIKREAGSWRWALFSALYTSAIAWIISFAVYQIGRMVIGA